MLVPTYFYAKSKYKLSTTLISALQNNANLAFQKPTFQSSNGFGGYSSLAVDGNTKTSYGDRSCTHTSQYNYDTWWMVDLQQVYRVSTVKITNRGDCCGECSFTFLVTSLWLHQCWRGNQKDIPLQNYPEGHIVACQMLITKCHLQMICITGP